MRSLRVLSLITISLLTILLSAVLLAQSSSSITDAVIKAPLIKQSEAIKDVSQPDPASQAKIRDGYGKLPLSFEANQGQADSQVKFLTRTAAYSMFLTRDEAVLVLRESKAKNKNKDNFPVETRLAASPSEANSAPTPDLATESVLRMKLRNANLAAKIIGTDELAGTSNYFIGNDPAKWRTNVPTYSKVKYEGIYSGIDLVFYGNQRQLEYDFIVAPGVDPHRIAFDISGANRIRKDEHGDLVFKTGEGEIRWHKPVAYQEKDGTRHLIAAHYSITDKNRVGFEIAGYDISKPLYIDPLIYSTYLGGSNYDLGYAIAVDSAGNAYVTGYTSSTDFPITPGGFPFVCDPGYSCYVAFVTKLNPTGSALVYSTYLGGSRENTGIGIAADSAGNAYVTGFTASLDFPTKNPLQPSYGGDTDAFVTKLNPTGSTLVYSTYLGGDDQDQGYGIAVDSTGNAYVTGYTDSTNYPTKDPLQPSKGVIFDAFVTKINPTGSATVYSTYLGGNSYDVGNGIAVDSAGNAYVTGYTDSTDFPTKNPLQAAFGGDRDAFVTKINPTGSALVYSTYFGGSGADVSGSIAVDSAGRAYVTGVTFSTDFPTKNPLQPSLLSGAGDAFVTKLNPTGSALIFSTYLGGKGGASGAGIAVDSVGNAYVTGSAGLYFPTNHQTEGYAGKGDAFVTKLNPTGSALVYSVYLGGNGSDGGSGIAVDSAGNAYVAGTTGSTNFPTLNPLQPANGGDFDVFVAKIIYAATTTRLTSSKNPSVSGKAVTFTATVSSLSGGTPTWKVTFRNGTTVLATKPLSDGTVSCTTSALPPGSNRITAVYGGDSNFGGSTSAPVSQFVLAATTTTLSSSLNPSIYGQAVTFTAVVTSSLGAPPDGETVRFEKGTTKLGTGTLSGGSASFTTSTLNVGTNVIKAAYAGDSNFAYGTSNPVSQVVNKAATRPR